MPAWIRRALLAAAVVLAGLLVAPRVYHNYDVVDCFLAWARATRGVQPADAYRHGVGADDCDYPPLVPYLLTLAEAGRRGARAPEVGALSVSLLKLPNLLAQVAPLFLFGSDPRWRRAAWWLALSPALFVNAAAWGQFDVLLSLLVVAALLALVDERPLRAGAAVGLGLATKLLAIAPVPVFGVWLARRQGARKLVAAIAVGLAVIGALALPLVLGGAGEGLGKAYAGAVNYYPLRTGEAYNTWYLLDYYDLNVRGIPGPIARRDDRAALGPLTFRHLGLIAFAAYTLGVLAALWRRPDTKTLLWATTLQLFAFFMLPTQVHQRYVVPVVAVAALLATVSARGLVLFVGLTLTATLNQGLDLLRALPWTSPIAGALLAADVPWDTRTIKDVAAVVAALNLGLFAWATLAFRREVGPAS